ncbi:hypothetical protein ACQP2Y_03785 [Actinoplanes sp. CA-051413]|uniref:hypothetical protein n=1 Tax=Actinoplanes sp. CA-051413 TaxID=3239899 RepID=UPI003D99EFD4
MTLEVTGETSLITPEGRCAITLLEGVGGQSELAESFQIDPVRAAQIQGQLLQLYRSWSRHRIESVLRLLQGVDKPLQIPAAGLILALLINRSTSSERATIRFRAGFKRQEVDNAFFEPVSAFVQILSPSTRADSRKWRLISGWVAGEARRRVGSAFVIERETSERDGRIYIREDRRGEVLDVVARDLKRTQEGQIDSRLLSDAWDGLVKAFRQSLPALAGYGLAHERTSETARLKQDLLRRFETDYGDTQ